MSRASCGTCGKAGHVWPVDALVPAYDGTYLERFEAEGRDPEAATFAWAWLTRAGPGRAGRVALARVEAAEAHGQGHVFPDRGPGQQAVVLEHEAGAGSNASVSRKYCVTPMSKSPASASISSGSASMSCM